MCQLFNCQLFHDHQRSTNSVSICGVEHMYIFLDYIPGGSLSTILADFILTESVIRKYSRQILEGLKYLHSQNIIHRYVLRARKLTLSTINSMLIFPLSSRDIKSQNLLLDEGGKVYLADFGCSTRLKEVLEQDTKFTGTPNYMAPEVIEKQQITKSADIWSFGCTVWEMFTRKPPYHHLMSRFSNAYQFFHHLLTTKEQLEIPDDISENAKDFLRHCLERDPDMRPTADKLLSHTFLMDPTEFSQEELMLIEIDSAYHYSETNENEHDEFDQFNFEDVDTYCSSDGSDSSDIDDDECNIRSIWINDSDSCNTATQEGKGEDTTGESEYVATDGTALSDHDPIFSTPSIMLEIASTTSDTVEFPCAMQTEPIGYAGQQQEQRQRQQQQQQQPKKQQKRGLGSSLSYLIPSSSSGDVDQDANGMDRRSLTFSDLRKERSELQASDISSGLPKRRSRSFFRKKKKIASREKDINNFLKKTADHMTVWAHPMKQVQAKMRAKAQRQQI